MLYSCWSKKGNYGNYGFCTLCIELVVGFQKGNYKRNYGNYKVTKKGTMVTMALCPILMLCLQGIAYRYHSEILVERHYPSLF